jgi:hypothetical protein
MDADPTTSVAATIPQVTAGLPDPDWYLDHVVLPRGPEGGRLGPMRAWHGEWRARALELRRIAPDGPVAGAVDQALRQGFVLRRRQALSAGLTESRLRRLVRSGTWSLPRHGVLGVLPRSDAVDASLRATAAALVRPGHVISHRSAALLHGLPLLATPHAPELTALRASTLGVRTACRVRGAALAADEVTDWFGAPITTIARAVVDLGRHDRAAALVAADAAMHEGLLTAAALDAAVARCSGWPGIRAVREVVPLVSPLAESPLESLTRLCLVDAGVPAPELQVEITDPADGWRCRVDMLWPAARVVLEADGKLKYTDRELWREKLRQERLERLGYRVVRALWNDVTARPEELVQRVRYYLHRPAPPLK